MRTISNTGLTLIKNFEGIRLNSYKCPSGVWTIGYGHTKNVKQGDIITQLQADIFLLEDVVKFQAAVNKYDNIYHFTQNEFDALVSFTFNCGVGNLSKLVANGKRSKDVIAEKILLYNKAGGKYLLGLARRRQSEHDLFIMK